MENTSEEIQVIKTVCMLCFMVCGINAHVKNGKLVKVEGMREHGATKGVVCPRGIHLPDYVHAPDRLKYPMIKGPDGSFERATWDEALDTLADKLQKIKDEFGAHAIAGSVGSNRGRRYPHIRLCPTVPWRLGHAEFFFRGGPLLSKPYHGPAAYLRELSHL